MVREIPQENWQRVKVSICSRCKRPGILHTAECRAQIRADFQEPDLEEVEYVALPALLSEEGIRAMWIALHDDGVPCVPCDRSLRLGIEAALPDS